MKSKLIERPKEKKKVTDKSKQKPKGSLFQSPPRNTSNKLAADSLHNTATSFRSASPAPSNSGDSPKTNSGNKKKD